MIVHEGPRLREPRVHEGWEQLWSAKHCPAPYDIGCQIKHADIHIEDGNCEVKVSHCGDEDGVGELELEVCAPDAVVLPTDGVLREGRGGPQKGDEPVWQLQRQSQPQRETGKLGWSEGGAPPPRLARAAFGGQFKVCSICKATTCTWRMFG